MTALDNMGVTDLATAELTATMSDAPSHAQEGAGEWVRVPGGVIDGGEIVILAVKPSLWRPFLDSAPWLLAAALFAAMIIAGSLSVAALGTTLSAQLVVVAGLARAGVAVIRWVPTWYLLTNRRVIVVRGVRMPRVTSRALLDIRNTYVQAAAPEKWLDIGVITFVTDHPHEVPFLWHAVPHAAEVHQRIRRAIENAIDRHGLGA